jgi:hypothetical protein
MHVHPPRPPPSEIRCRPLASRAHPQGLLHAAGRRSRSTGARGAAPVPPRRSGRRPVLGAQIARAARAPLPLGDSFLKRGARGGGSKGEGRGGGNGGQSVRPCGWARGRTCPDAGPELRAARLHRDHRAGARPRGEVAAFRDAATLPREPMLAQGERPPPPRWHLRARPARQGSVERLAPLPPRECRASCSQQGARRAARGEHTDRRAGPQDRESGPGLASEASTRELVDATWIREEEMTVVGVAVSIPRL